MKYFPMHEVVLAHMDDTVSVSTGSPSKILANLLTASIETVGINEGQYLDLYPDVEAEVAAGRIESATIHFARHGYFEKRVGLIATFDPVFYRQMYPDLDFLQYDDDGSLAAEHFLEFGWREWRLPCEEAATEAEIWRRAMIT